MNLAERREKIEKRLKFYSCDVLEKEKIVYITHGGYEGAAGADRSYDRVLTLEQVKEEYRDYAIYEVVGSTCTKIEPN